MNSTWVEFWGAVLPPLATLIAAVIAYGLTKGAAALKARTGIEIERSDRDALHRALMTGVQAALAKLGPQASLKELVEEAKNHVAQSTPQAVLRLNPDPATLTRLAMSKVEEARAEAKPC